MTEPTHEQKEKLLRLVSDLAKEFQGDSHNTSTAMNFSRLFMLISDLCIALIGGYHKEGQRQ